MWLINVKLKGFFNKKCHLKIEIKKCLGFICCSIQLVNVILGFIPFLTYYTKNIYLQISFWTPSTGCDAYAAGDREGESEGGLRDGEGGTAGQDEGRGVWDGGAHGHRGALFFFLNMFINFVWTNRIEANVEYIVPF